MVKKSVRRLAVFLFALLISAAALFFHMYTSSQDSSSSVMYASSRDGFSGAYSLLEEEAWKNTMAERIASAIKCVENVEDVSINTEAELVEVNITMAGSPHLLPDVREPIERLVDAAFPGAAVDFTESDSEN